MARTGNVHQLRPRGGKLRIQLADLAFDNMAPAHEDVLEATGAAASEPGVAGRGTWANSGSTDDLPVMLSLYVVYDHPADYPDHYVVRRWVVSGGQSAPVGGPVRQETELETIRGWLEREKGLARIPRDGRDDPAILEVWI